MTGYKSAYANRLFAWLVVYSVLLVGCFIVFQYKREKTFKASELNSQLQLINSYIGKELADGKNIADIDLTELQPFDDMRVSIISNHGEVIYDTSFDSIPGTNHLNREEIAAANENGSGYTLRRNSESTGGTYFYSATLTDDGTIVRTAVPYTLTLDYFLKADDTFMWIMGGLALVFCGFGYVATRRVGQHIRRLKRFAESAEKGIKIYNTEPFPHDELGDISNHIVRLYYSLQQAISERDREHSMALHEQQEKERIKKQLTNNINHELKTPIASMQVCLETLLSYPDMNKEKRVEFLKRCFTNNQRLKQLLADVSLITRIDDGAATIAKEDIDLTEIIRYVVDERTDTADQRGFTIQNDVVKPIELKGNQSLWESVFFNLIDNAISYSGGDRITISEISGCDNKTIITLCDNGCGVAEEHLPRLFERFYRIDKGRSRAAGGTGLGLSIVKNAIQLHGGSVSVSNGTRGGLCFKIMLPKCG